MQNQLENNFVYGGFFVRAAAYLTDLLFSGIIVSLVKFPFDFLSWGSGNFLTKNILFQYTALDMTAYFLGVFYFILLTYYTHTTVGKALFQLRVITNKEKWNFFDVLYRETIGRFLSGICLIGYIVAGCDKEKRGFHDMLADTRVIYKFKPVQPVMRKAPVQQTVMKPLQVQTATPGQTTGQATASVQFIKPVRIISSAQPVNPEQSVQPINPNQPVQPINPNQPVQSINPEQPIQIVQPAETADNTQTTLKLKSEQPQVKPEQTNITEPPK